MNLDAKQFLQFIAATLVLGLVGGAVVKAGLPRSFALPFGLLWLAAFLAATGYIIGGKTASIELLRMVGLTFGILFAVVIAISFALGY